MKTFDFDGLFNYFRNNHCVDGKISLTLEELDSLQEKFRVADLDFFKNIFDDVPCTISVIDKNLEYIKVNKTLAKICKLDPSDFIGREVGFFTKNKYFYNFVHKFFNSDLKRLSQEISTTFNNEKRVFWVTGNKINRGTEIILIGVDITGVRKLEDQVQFNEKLTALGEMVAGIVHDIKNPLTVISTSSSFLRKVDKLNDEKILKISDKISSTSERILKIVDSIKVFIRNGEDEPLEDTNVLDLIHEACEICNFKIHSGNVEIKFLNPDESFSTLMNTTKIFQVFVNLFSNACDAISDLDLTEVRPWVSIEFDTSLKVVKFRDCGKGIPKDIQKNIFEAFYTTKPIGVGSGLGLSNCKRIMQEHGGDITIDENDENTCFIINFSKNE